MLQQENTVLVVVDVQGKLAQLMYEREALIDNLTKLIRGARELDLPILWLEQVPEKLGPTVPEVAECLQGIHPIPKSSFSGCGNMEFMDDIEACGRKQVLVAGIEAHVCVYQTVADLVRLGYEVQVAVDAVSSRTAANRGLGIERMRLEGARPTSVEMALFELLRVAEGDRFRRVSALIK
ncbi:hydrolase [Alkalilimnicola ehrlichii]|uniref:Hydrolase n=1 Tax=Alkalilimnicola ehrlichii TaxID=351052 RepID=A0A3E0WHB3_9GAMM|nr:hydrolase [Alkalilimnicola ehrlichii]RFA24493.1 hydrolase [Alkalilimnicola ehrlichii]RFA32158.1 hydrolase [Alkalilimnicola ehrlichii]